MKKKSKLLNKFKKSKIVNLFITFISWSYKKLIEILYIFTALLFIAFIYYIFTWIYYSNTNTKQIEDFIKKQIVIPENYYIDKKLIDVKWYWEKDLFIKLQSLNYKDDGDYIYIFSHKQKSFFQDLLFKSNLYSKEFQYNTPKWIKIDDIIVMEINNSNFVILKMYNINSNDVYYWIINYWFNKYNIYPLFWFYNNKHFDWINCYNENWDIDLLCENWVKNILLNNYNFSIINNEKHFLDINNIICKRNNFIINSNEKIKNGVMCIDDENNIPLYIKSYKNDRFIKYDCSFIRWKLKCDSDLNYNNSDLNYLLIQIYIQSSLSYYLYNILNDANEMLKFYNAKIN